RSGCRFPTKHLDAVVARIRYDDRPVGPDRHAAAISVERIELTRAGASAAEGKEKRPRGVEDLDPVVARIHYEDRPVGPNRHALGTDELPVAGARAAEGEEKPPRRIKHLDAMRVRHDDCCVGPDRHVPGTQELPVAGAPAADGKEKPPRRV